MIKRTRYSIREQAELILIWYHGAYMMGSNVEHVYGADCQLESAFKCVGESFNMQPKPYDTLYRFAIVYPANPSPLTVGDIRVVNPGGMFNFQSWTSAYHCALDFSYEAGLWCFDDCIFSANPGGVPCIISVSNPNPQDILFDLDMMLRTNADYWGMDIDEEIPNWVDQKEVVFKAGRSIKVKIEKLVDI